MPDLNYILPDEHDQEWALLRGMVITVIDEVKNSDTSTDVNDSIADVNDFLVTGSSTGAEIFFELSSAEIADREIKIWKTRTVPFPKDKDLLDEVASRCCASFPLVWCVGEACTCYFCDFSSSWALVFHGR